jgi:Lipocalin-like domain
VAATPTEIAAAARDYFAYCGTYEFQDDTVVHRVALSLMPNWIGGEQARLVALNGDTVTLSTPPTPVGGRQQRGTLVWQRV